MAQPQHIQIEHWHHQCGDRCCDEFGMSITLPDGTVHNVPDGDVAAAVRVVLQYYGVQATVSMAGAQEQQPNGDQHSA